MTTQKTNEELIEEYIQNTLKMSEVKALNILLEAKDQECKDKLKEVVEEKDKKIKELEDEWYECPICSGKLEKCD